MYEYGWDAETGGLLLTNNQAKLSKEPRPVYYRELDILGFDQYWNYPKDECAPLMWAEANNYIYRGKLVAATKGGSLYTKPELVLIEEPEPDGAPLRFVDIDAMCRKNHELMEALANETIQRIYDTYLQYQNKVDVFYVAFSGGKDSVVALDLVQRALPHDSFLVLFGDTRMEFSDTYDTVEAIKNQCERNNIPFLVAASELEPSATWTEFGPPCTVTRWCCSVHKTVPQILLLRQRLKMPDFTGIAFVGVRADESLSRSRYDDITFGGKHKKQSSCNVIFRWSSAEVFLYIYSKRLILNETYKKGNRRAGCLICPRASERNDFMNHYCYPKAEKFVDFIRKSYSRTFPDSDRLEQFIQNGGWKARKNGRDLDIPMNYQETSEKGRLIIKISFPKTDWKIWIKTIGILITNQSPYRINFQGKTLLFSLEESTEEIQVEIDERTCRDNPVFVKLLKNVFRKSACCVACRECQADCPYGKIDFINGNVVISDTCYHCAQCHKVEKGCLVYKSLEQPKGGVILVGKLASLNSYSHHAPKMDWFRQYFELKDEFDNKHSLGSNMYSFFKRFLRDAKLLDKDGFSQTAKLIDKIGYETQTAWGIIYINLCYTPQINWYINHVGVDTEYSKQLLVSMMIESGAKESWTNDIFSSLGRISELPMGELGFGRIIKEGKQAVAIIRKPWHDPIPEVILYGLYKFAEACGDYYQFTLETLLDDSIERDGVSPTRIFGLDRKTMVRILNGLTSSYPDFISASFTLDLDNITLREDKKAEDVLELFKGGART